MAVHILFFIFDIQVTKLCVCVGGKTIHDYYMFMISFWTASCTKIQMHDFCFIAKSLYDLY